MTKSIELSIKVQKPFGNLFRKESVLVIVETSQKEFLLGTKPRQYPPTISRLLGGGVHEGEHEGVAARREIYEELGVKLDESQMRSLFTIDVRAEDDNGSTYTHKVHIFYTNIGSNSFQAGDDVEEIIKLSLDGLYELSRAYDSLPETLWYNGPEGMYSWNDYAKLYGPVHRLSAEAVSELHSNK